MWLIVGVGSETKPVSGGVRVSRPCGKCRAWTTFIEHESRDFFRLYFVNIAAVRGKRLLRCAGCGEGAITDELEQPATDQRGTVAGAVSSAVQKGKEALEASNIDEKLADAGERVSDAVENAANRLSRFLRNRNRS